MPLLMMSIAQQQAFFNAVLLTATTWLMMPFFARRNKTTTAWNNAGVTVSFVNIVIQLCIGHLYTFVTLLPLRAAGFTGGWISAVVLSGLGLSLLLMIITSFLGTKKEPEGSLKTLYLFLVLYLNYLNSFEAISRFF
ncbi:hypothetical protein Ga0466249_004823 [Sporomusaceae bacterium BoRhaA]|nr:hypothetical protein [Pelorhabdus rhamnosifermentans]